MTTSSPWNATSCRRACNQSVVVGVLVVERMGINFCRWFVRVFVCLCACVRGVGALFKVCALDIGVGVCARTRERERERE